MRLADYKRDDRPKHGGWAPGSYCNKCCDCGAGFIGDKRAVACADCAYGPPRPQQHVQHIIDWMLHGFNERMNAR